MTWTISSTHDVSDTPVTSAHLKPNSPDETLIRTATSNPSTTEVNAAYTDGRKRHSASVLVRSPLARQLIGPGAILVSHD